MVFSRAWLISSLHESVVGRDLRARRGASWQRAPARLMQACAQILVRDSHYDVNVWEHADALSRVKRVFNQLADGGVQALARLHAEVGTRGMGENCTSTQLRDAIIRGESWVSENLRSAKMSTCSHCRSQLCFCFRRRTLPGFSAKEHQPSSGHLLFQRHPWRYKLSASSQITKVRSLHSN